MIPLFGRRPRLPAAQVTLEAKSVKVKRGPRTVLDGVDLDVRPGEVLALVGPNGAGKSTLLAALCGDIEAEGTIFMDGLPLADWRPIELAMRRSILMQKHTLAFPYTSEEVVRMGRAPWANTLYADDDDSAVAQAMKEADAHPFASRPFPELSGGEQARVALARVLAQRAPIVLLDEPTAALDVRHQELVFAVARAQASQGRSIVAVVHDLALAAAHADRVAILHNGRLAACGTPEAVMTASLLSDVYEHDIEVFAHPRTGKPLILPFR